MTDYQPTRKPKRLPDSGTSQPVASDNGPGDIPAALHEALAAAEVTLKARDGVYSVLVASHDDIPRLLRDRESLQAEIARDEVVSGGAGQQLKARMTECDSRLEEWRRKRRGAASVLLSDDRCGQAALLRARDAVTAARTAYTQAIVAEHRRKYDQAVEALQALWAAGDQLAAALRTEVPLPLPARVSDHPVRSGQIERVPGPATVPAALPPGALRVRETLDRLDGALSVCGGIARVHELSGILGRRQSIGLSESVMADTGGVFLVVDNIRNGVDQMEHARGDLVDAELLGGAGAMQRAIAGRLVRRAQFDVVTTAA